jgi:hypothetical protein
VSVDVSLKVMRDCVAIVVLVIGGLWGLEAYFQTREASLRSVIQSIERDIDPLEKRRYHYEHVIKPENWTDGDKSRISIDESALKRLKEDLKDAEDELKYIKGSAFGD